MSSCTSVPACCPSLLRRGRGLLRHGMIAGMAAGLLALAAMASEAQEAAIDPTLAKQYFEEAKALSDKDHGSLWNVALCGPILFVDRGTRAAVANQADQEGKLKPANGVFAGTAPPELGVANTATDWAGVEWTMVMWPVPESKAARLRLILHECFHRVQKKIGLPATDSLNGHLDSLHGRIWLQMVWRALEHAFWQQGEERRRDVADAVYFRNYRRSLFPGSEAREDALEMNEGMAEYTGVKLSTSSAEEFAVVTAAWLRSAPTRTASFGRSFAYTSGPAYGGLLDAANPEWRSGLTPATDLGQLLAHAYGVQLPAPDKTEALRRAERYEGSEVIAIETRREEQHQAQVAAAKKLFVEGPVLVLPVSQKFGYTFDPNAVLALDETLTLYQGDVQVTDEWGVLKASEGALFARENGKIVRVQVPAPADNGRDDRKAVNGRDDPDRVGVNGKYDREAVNGKYDREAVNGKYDREAVNAKAPLAGKGWTLDLKPRWKIVPGGRTEDFAVRKQSQP